jgi:hypothetical protein
VQFLESFSNFLSFPKTIRAMEKENFQPVRAQPRQDGIDTLEDVIMAKIKALRCPRGIVLPANPALGLDDDSISEGRSLSALGENLLRLCVRKYWRDRRN